MGMFDNVQLKHKDIVFQGQTKDLGWQFCRFKITNKGNLKKLINNKWYKYPYVGLLTIYTYHKDQSWEEYRIEFENTKVTSIRHFYGPQRPKYDDETNFNIIYDIRNNGT